MYGRDSYGACLVLVILEIAKIVKIEWNLHQDLDNGDKKLISISNWLDIVLKFE